MSADPIGWAFVVQSGAEESKEKELEDSVPYAIGTILHVGKMYA